MQMGRDPPRDPLMRRFSHEIVDQPRDRSRSRVNAIWQRDRCNPLPLPLPFSLSPWRGVVKAWCCHRLDKRRSRVKRDINLPSNGLSSSIRDHGRASFQVRNLSRMNPWTILTIFLEGLLVNLSKTLAIRRKEKRIGISRWLHCVPFAWNWHYSFNYPTSIFDSTESIIGVDRLRIEEI